MLAQVGRHLFGAAAFIVEPGEYKSSATAHSYAFVKALDRLRVERAMVTGTMNSIEKLVSMEQARMANYHNPVIHSLASCFLHDVGTKQWEHFFGKAWDEAIKSKEE